VHSGSFRLYWSSAQTFQQQDIGSGRLTIWWWDPGIHQSDGLLQMRLTIDKAEVVIGLHHDGDEVRGVVEFFFSLMMPRIEDSRELTGVDFTEISWPSMIHDREFKKRNTQFEHGGQTVMIGGMQPQHNGSSLCLAWDPGIAVVDNSAADTDGMASLHSPGFTLGAWSFEKSTEPRLVYDCLAQG
jgi:hypothetical protein